MEKDAVAAGISEIGGLVNTTEIRILICYIMSSIPEPVPGQLLADVLHYEGLANYFEVSDAIAFLTEGGQLQIVDEKENTYTATASGKDVAQTLRSSLSVTVKERAYAAALKMMVRYKNEKETDICISHEGGHTFIACTAKDGDLPFMSVKLLVADEEQAQFVKNKFLDSKNLYSKIMELITK